MIKKSVQEALALVENYLENTAITPFFVNIDGSKEYTETLNRLSAYAGRIYTSDFCTDDSYPNYDALCDEIENKEENSILLGLGEAISLSGKANALGKIKDLYPKAKTIVLCRGVRKELMELMQIDSKFDSRRVCYVESLSSFKIVRYARTLKVNVMAECFKQILKILEDGKDEYLTTKTDLPICGAKEITCIYDAIKLDNPEFVLERHCLSDEMWAEYYFDKSCKGYDVIHWRTYLSYLVSPIKNLYVKFVMKDVNNYSDYKQRLFDALIQVPVKDKTFWSLYVERKSLLKQVKNSDIAEYISRLTEIDTPRIYYLTDNNSLEKREIISEICRIGDIPKELGEIYPALCDYLQNYNFTCKNGDVFTSYFAEYKQQKLKNVLLEKFMLKVLKLSAPGNRIYNSLKTRGAILEQFDSTKDTLFWVDALGVEFLGYIQKRASYLGLKINIQVGRAELPTLTYINKDFYDNWTGKKEQTKKLDELKHKGEQAFNYTNCKEPIHLAEELAVIDEVLDWFKTELGSKRSTRIILTSDHGASRLSVICNTENKWEMATIGEHSGRCCPTNEIDEKPDCATEENNYWVLANYDRFKGGRKASVEVHGGATLEEVLVPVIDISLQNASIDIKNETPITESDNLKTIPSIILYSSYVLNAVSVYFNGRYYPAIRDDSNIHKHKVTFEDFRKAGDYIADVYEKDNLIGQIAFTIDRKSGRVNDDNDFFS